MISRDFLFVFVFLRCSVDVRPLTLSAHGGPPPPLPPRSARKHRDAKDQRGDASPPPLPPRRISAPLDGTGKPPLGPGQRSTTAPLYNGTAGTPPTPTSGFPKAPMPLPYGDHHIPHGTFVYPPPPGYHPPPPTIPLPMQPPPARGQSHVFSPGASAVGPELPPKTYRQNHGRQDGNQGPLHSPGYQGP